MEANSLEFVKTLLEASLPSLSFLSGVAFLPISLTKKIEVPWILSWSPSEYARKMARNIGIYLIGMAFLLSFVNNGIVGKGFASEKPHNFAEYRVINYLVPNGKVNVRKYPNPSHAQNILGQVKDGDSIKILPKLCEKYPSQQTSPKSSAWVPIEYKGQEGWINREFLTEQ
ncbi:MAG: SH3 domain-containing protein [Oscillatoria sp. SIO1A7]|nr:SH3 domain-containing protein [Oscillatoria sp. SIO1A7]